MDVLKDLVRNESPDWNQIRKLIRSNKSLVSEPLIIDNDDNNNNNNINNNNNNSKDTSSNDTDVRSIIHYAIAKQAPSNIVMDLFWEHEGMVDDYCGEYLLSVARYDEKEKESAMALIGRKYPNGADDIVIKKCQLRCLVTPYGTSTRKPDGTYTDIVWHKPNWEKIMDYIISNNTNELIEEPIDSIGNYVFHHASWHCAPIKFIQELYSMSSKAISIPNSNGDYPLHLACLKTQLVSVIEFLVTQYPHAIQVQNNQGKYPFHIALDREQPESVCQLVYYPKARLEYLLLSYKSSSALDWDAIIELVHSNNNNHDLVQTIISEPPIYDGEGDETIDKMAWCGPHLLHYAIRRNAPYDFVIELIEEYPPAMEVLVDGWYPLYYACIKNQPTSVIQLLLDKFPKAIEQAPLGWYPVHLTCNNKKNKKPSEEIIQFLIEKYPNPVEIEQNQKAYTEELFELHHVLHHIQSESFLQFLYTKFPKAFNNNMLQRLLATKSPNWNSIQLIIQSNKEIIQRRLELESNGWYLLHYACRKRAPSSFVIELMNNYPEAIQMKDHDGWYPLHIACAHHQSEVVVKFLINTYPQAIEEKTNDGQYPLHLACCYSQSKPVIRLLVTKFEKAIQVKIESSGEYPLHLIFRGKASISVIELLMNKYPDALYKKSNHGWYPLHYACRYRYSQSLRVVQLLISTYSQAVAEKDIDGWYPLHLAIKYRHSFDLIKQLILQYPAAINAPTNDTRCYPLHLACRKERWDETLLIRTLIEEYPPALVIPTLYGKHPRDLVPYGSEKQEILSLLETSTKEYLAYRRRQTYNWLLTNYE